MPDLTFAPYLNGFAVRVLAADADHVELRVVAVAPLAAYPVCHQPTAPVHSRYERRVADLPWSRDLDA